MLLTKEVEVKLNSYNVEYYKNMGYDIPTKKASKSYYKKYKKEFVYDFSKTITVKIEDLQKGSHVEVEALCDYCKKEVIHMTYNSYNKRIKDVDKIACRHCFTIKAKESNMLKYGVENYSQTKECHKKMEDTMERLYGVKHALQSHAFLNSYKNTCKKRYGEDYSNVFAKKAFDTHYRNTGVLYPSQLPETREKIKDSFIKKYGVDNPNKSPEVRDKIAKTLYSNSSQKTSRQQRYICDLYGGILNYPRSYYNVDIYLQDDNLIIEYDGGGHLLNVVTGRETIEEHNRKEIIRHNVIKREGYKQMRIISLKDRIPSDIILLQMLDETKKYFSNYPEHSWIEYDIDTSVVRNAEHKDGVFFDFKKLRKINNVA